MKLPFLPLLVMALACSMSMNHCLAQIISAELLNSYTPAEVIDISNDFGIPPDILPISYGVDYYQVVYQTLHPNGDSVLVSGGLALPQAGLCSLPLVCYAHGTTTTSQDVPSNIGGEGLLGILYASSGYIVALPDYIGFGVSDLFHPYVHAESEAQTCLDLMRAAVDLQTELDFQWNNQTFIFGYSQGGHAAMALHRKIELEFPDEFTVTACAPMSGPYDISGVQTDLIIADEPFAFSGFLPYVVMGYQAAYGNLYDSLDELFIEPYSTTLPDLFDGTNSIGYISAQLPAVPSEMLLPEVFEAFQTDPQHPLRLVLADNDVYDWAPNAPTRLYYCTEDEQVNYLNALVAEEAMIENGAADIEALNGGPYTHGECASLAMIGGFFFFENYREYNFQPELEYATIAASGADTEDGSIQITSDTDLSTSTFTWSNGATGNPLTNAAPGTYIAYVSDENGCTVSLETELEFAIGIDRPSASTYNLVINDQDNSVSIYWETTASQVRLFDLQGKLLYSNQIQTGFNMFYLPELKTGLYLAKIGNGENMRSHKIILSR
jgi:pimeloyl-ACP methyl ester carboxylesterase